MATFRKRGEKWAAEVCVRRQRRSKSFATKAAARQWAAEQESQLSEDRYQGPETVRDALARYAREVSPGKKGARWEIVRLEKMQRDRLADVQVRSLAASDIADWRDRRLREIAPSSVNRELNLLSSVCERARKEWGWLTANPVRDVQRPRNPRHRDRRISDDEVTRILAALGFDEDWPVETAQQQIAVAFLLALETAMRLGELIALQWADVRLTDRYLTIRDSKNSDTRDVPLSRRADALFRLLPGGDDRVFKCSRDTASVLFARAVKRAGIEGVTFHTSRHEAISRLARKLDVLDLARMIGHRDPRSLMIYFSATASEIAGRLD
jgi:integrase